MVLLIGGVKVKEAPRDSRNLFMHAPHLKDSASQLAVQMPKVVGPMQLLYVSQREFAVCAPQDKNISIMGTDDCTTCLAIVLRNSTTGATAVGHLESVAVEGISAMITRLQDIMGYIDPGPLQMHIVGSFSDTRGYSEELIYAVLHFVHSHPVEVELLTACIGDLNTIHRGETPWPIVLGIGVNVKTGEIFPATFPDKGPDMALRLSRIFTGNRILMDVYDFSSGLLKVGPFHYEPLRCANIMLQQSDEFILHHLSSSPEVEPPHFVSQARETLKYIQDHPFPEITIFPENQARYFRKDEHGNWNFVRLEYSRFE